VIWALHLPEFSRPTTRARLAVHDPDDIGSVVGVVYSNTREVFC
jgi:hypothetical protein